MAIHQSRNTGTCIKGRGTTFAKDDVPQASYEIPNVLQYERTDTDQTI